MIENLTCWLNAFPRGRLALVLCTFFLTITPLAGFALNLVPVDGPAIDPLVAAAPYLKKGPIPANAYGFARRCPASASARSR
jgi:hypothetical protein